MVWALLQELEPGALHERGFHPTAIWERCRQPRCARLNHLNAEDTTNAIAIAASLAAGTVANFGTMTKSLHAGDCAIRRAGGAARQVRLHGIARTCWSTEPASCIRTRNPAIRQ
jgi:hypothetical protein